ncbi:LysM peptidoglycan-binding domain-containing protein [Flavobacteriales bacterium]|nr:LysM peptidoglycan-binding domain-containing protein [Flavobacteriales bacterium]
MPKLNLALITLSVCLCSLTMAQIDHGVKNGETLYNLSKKYNISIQDIVRANPEAKRGLHEGMNIFIPSTYKNADTIAYKLHKVRPLESFYSLKSKYGTGEKELLRLNPTLTEGFRSGSFIKIPLIVEEVEEDFMVINAYDDEIEVRQDGLGFIEKLKSRTSKFSKKESYNIAFLLPLYLDKNDTIEVYQDLDNETEIYKKTHYALDFYSGAKIAIDSLNKAGMNINVHVFDTQNDPNITFDLVTKSAFNDMDLVVGPFYSKNFKIAAELLGRRKTPIIAPLSTKNNLTVNSPNAYQVIPTSERQVTYLSDYISGLYADQCITVVRRNSKEDKQNASWMLSSFDLDTTSNYKEIVVKGAVIDSIHHEIDSMAAKNVFLIPSTEKAFVTDLLTKLNATRDSSLIVFGMADWYKFKELDYTYLMNLDVHIPNSGFLSYQDTLTQYFVKNYQESTRKAPNERFAFAGFDITYYFLSMLNEYGTVSPGVYLEPMNLLNMNFDFNATRRRRDGARNQSVQIIKYDDFKITTVRE